MPQRQCSSVHRKGCHLFLLVRLIMERQAAKRREADGVQEHRQECNMERARLECRVQKDQAEQVWYQEKPRRRSA